MGKIGATLLKNLPSFQIFGANTNVGKTVASTLLCKGFRDKGLKTLYVKPVSTGSIEHVDSRHVSRFADGVTTHTLFQFSKPCSPHIAARLEGNVPEDSQIVRDTFNCLLQHKDHSAAIVETAGGVLSPAPSGNAQADVYRPMRLPVVLVGDYHLGGIATTTSAYESLKLRGYDVLLHVIFMEPEYMNSEYLDNYFKDQNVPTLSLMKPPPPAENVEQDTEAMWGWYSFATSMDSVHYHLNQLLASHKERIERLESMSERASNTIWYPFTQHKILNQKDIVTIDSAYEDNFDVLSTKSTQNESLLKPAFDASASWWTQGLGHGNPALALTAAYAAGRYGHVMFAGAVHEPALELAEKLLEGHKNERLAKVFYSDDGSTGVEVGVKMALRAACDRYGWNKDDVKVLGLKGSYHGDTIGAMDCSEPNTYNERVEWYEPKGAWLDYPKIMMKNGIWSITMPPELADLSKSSGLEFDNLEAIFRPSRFEPTDELYQAYEKQIKATLTQFRESGHKFGALLIEPILLGAGGMLFSDPLYQHVLVNTVRNNPALFSQSDKSPSSSIDWSGLPVVFDEVFVGLTRLGPAHFNTSQLLRVNPDIVVNAKLLTGGLLPLATTAASQSIFDSFLSDAKSDALLHGHSYTAHATGCAVGLASLKAINENKSALISFWSDETVDRISHLDNVEGVFAMGTVLAVTLRDTEGGGYTSSAAESVKQKLLEVQEGSFVHSRVLGNVIYFMTGLNTKEGRVREVETRILSALETK